MANAQGNMAILGLQWGDEGKGKLVDLVSRGFQHVVRFQGGNNAGHTVVVDGQNLALHQVPSGALHPGCCLVVANGVVLNLAVLQEELARLRDRGVDLSGRLRLSEKAHVILPHHIALDRLREGGGGRIGTTGRGIGPAYEMKAARMGIRLGDLRDPDGLADKIRLGHAEVLNLGGAALDLPDPEAVAAETLRLGASLMPMIQDTQAHLFEAWARGESILFEGAQATMLDLDHGTYPYVTSSHCSIGGLFTGTGLPPKALQMIVGVAKAYTTRVGDGPMPSELQDATGDHLRERGREFGTTTGRPRRCGWFDGPVTAYACRTNGVDGLAVMKLDVLDELDTIGIVTAYRDGSGALCHSLPSCARDWAEIRPEVRHLAGWRRSTRGVRDPRDLPSEARTYLDTLAELTGTPIAYLSTGPDRTEGFAVAGSILDGRL